MPEAAEVKIISEQLAKRVSNRQLKEVIVHGGRYTKSEIPGLEKINENTPVNIIGAGCHGKFSFIIMEEEWSLWISLGMTAVWTKEKEKHSHVELVLNDGSIFFTDPRRFGTLKFVKGSKQLVEKLESLGPDIMKPITDDLFMERIRAFGKKKTIVEVMMDQSVFAGIGNYIKSEALYRSKISPHRDCLSLSDTELVKLKLACQEVVHESYLMGGNTLKDYRGLDGKPGNFASKLQVYNKSLDPNGYKVLKEETKDKRTSFWVKEIQI